MDKFEVQRVHCPKFHGRVSDVIIDSQHSSKVLAVDDEGNVHYVTGDRYLQGQGSGVFSLYDCSICSYVYNDMRLVLEKCVGL